MLQPSDTAVYCNPNDTLEIAQADSTQILFASINNNTGIELTSPLYQTVTEDCSVVFLRQRGYFSPQFVSKVYVHLLKNPAFTLDEIPPICMDNLDARITSKDASVFSASKISYFIDGKFAGQASASPFDVSIPLAKYIPGNHVLTAYATDNFGGHYQSSKLVTLCANTIDVPENDVTVYCTRKETLKISGNAQVFQGATDFLLSADGKIVQKQRIGANGGNFVFLWPPDLSEAGKHRITVRCVYNSGQTTNIRAFHIILLDSEPLSLDAPSTPCSSILNVSSSANARGDFAPTKISYLLDGVQVTQTTQAPFKAAVDLRSLHAGGAMLEVIATDDDNGYFQLWKLIDIPERVKVDGIPDHVSRQAEGDGVPIKCQLASDFSPVKIIYSVDGNEIASSDKTPFSAMLDLKNYPTGSHNVIAKAYDTDNREFKSIPFAFHFQNVVADKEKADLDAKIIKEEEQRQKEADEGEKQAEEAKQKAQVDTNNAARQEVQRQLNEKPKSPSAPLAQQCMNAIVQYLARENIGVKLDEIQDVERDRKSEIYTHDVHAIVKTASDDGTELETSRWIFYVNPSTGDVSDYVGSW
jgi:hypothetical protein